MCIQLEKFMFTKATKQNSHQELFKKGLLWCWRKKRIIFFELKQWSHLKFLKKFVNVNFAKKTISNCTYNYVKVMTEILTLRTYSNEIYFIWLVAIQDRILFKIHLRSLFELLAIK